MPALPKTKKTKFSRIKKRAWDAFSRYIRTRDSLATTGTTTRCICITCNKEVDFRDIQAGHATGGRDFSILFDEDIVNGQCSGCNMSGGQYDKYAVALIKRHGLEKYEELLSRKNSILKLKAYQLLEIEQMYKDKLNSLQSD